MDMMTSSFHVNADTHMSCEAFQIARYAVLSNREGSIVLFIPVVEDVERLITLFTELKARMDAL